MGQRLHGMAQHRYRSCTADALNLPDLTRCWPLISGEAPFVDGGLQAQENLKTSFLHSAAARGEAGTTKEARWNTTCCAQEMEERDGQNFMHIN